MILPFSVNSFKGILIICLFFSLLLPIYNYDIYAKTIYVSSSGSDLNEGTIESPVLTLKRAKQICRASSDSAFTILLKGGDVFTEHIPTVSEFDGNRTCAFIWDINKPLTISTYGSEEKAHLYGGFYRHNGGPVAAILIIEPSTQDVLIENLSFEMWEEGTIIIYETEDVVVRNIKIDRIGTYYFQDEISDAFMPAGIYPKNSRRVLIENVEMSNAHNWRGDRGGLHGFYCTRMADLEIRNCLLTNISGSAFKIRREPNGRGPNNILIHNNECYYTGLSNYTPDDESNQPGFLRYSGEFYNDNSPNCPSAIVISDNILHYPFCWNSEGEDCETSFAFLCSTSNETACGDNACFEDSNKVIWSNNDIIYDWQLTDYWIERNTVPPEAPTQLTAVAVSDNQIDLSWSHDMNNVERFVIDRKNEWTGYRALINVDSGYTSYSDKNLDDSTLYSYRIKACYDAACSEYSNEIEDSTSGGVKVAAPGFLSANISDGNYVTLRWLDASRNEEGFIIEKRDESSEYSILDTSAANTKSYVDSLVQDSVTYFYRVRTYRKNVLSKFSNEVSITVPVTDIADHIRNEVPLEFALEQNYPNPFNPSTTISYRLPETSKVQLRIFNVHGQIVDILVNRIQHAGYHNMQWHPENLSSGVYYYQLKAGRFITTQRLVLLK